MKYPSIHTRMLKLQRLIIQNIDKDVEQLVDSYIVGGNANVKLTIWKVI